jgi:hypothetical protein
MKMEQTEGSEMLVHKIHALGNHPKERMQQKSVGLLTLLFKFTN